MCIMVFVFFTIQVYLRINVYLDYNTTTDVQVVYTNSVPFPATTICNQNNFRYYIHSKQKVGHMGIKGASSFVDRLVDLDRMASNWDCFI